MNEHEDHPDKAVTGSPRFNLRVEIGLVCFLFVASLLIHIWFLKPSPFDGLYGQDSFAYYDFAGQIRALVSQGHPLGAFFWPLGYPALLALGFSLFGTQAIIGQAINIILGAALTPLIYILARQIGLKWFGAIVAAILITLNGQAIQSSIVLMSDIPSLFWATLSAVLLWMYFRPRISASQTDSPPQFGKLRWLVLSAVLLAIAGITRWLYLALAPGWVLAVLILWRGRIRWRESIIVLIFTALIFIPQIIYSSTNPWPTLNNAWVEGWSPANAFQHEFTNIDGHFIYDQINAIYYAQPYYVPYYMAAVFAPFLLIGLWWMFRHGYAKMIMFAIWAFVPYIFLAGIPYQNIRFPLIVVPAVVILAGAGLETVVDWIARIRIPRIAALAYLVAVIILLYGTSQSLPIDHTNVVNFINNQQRDKDTAAWAAQNVPGGATLYTFGLTLTLQHYTTLNVYELYYETPETLAAKWKIGQDDYLLINVWDIENQWAGRDPQLDYHWMRDHRGLIKLGTYGYYTLYKVEGENNGNVG